MKHKFLQSRAPSKQSRGAARVAAAVMLIYVIASVTGAWCVA